MTDSYSLTLKLSSTKIEDFQPHLFISIRWWDLGVLQLTREIFIS